jgi:hypothetical protein
MAATHLFDCPHAWSLDDRLFQALRTSPTPAEPARACPIRNPFCLPVNPFCPTGNLCCPTKNPFCPTGTCSARLFSVPRIIRLLYTTRYKFQGRSLEGIRDFCREAASVFAASNIRMSNPSTLGETQGQPTQGKPFDDLRARQQQRASIRPAQLALTTGGIRCNSHARPVAETSQRGKRRQGNQLNFCRRHRPIRSRKFHLPFLAWSKSPCTLDVAGPFVVCP